MWSACPARICLSGRLAGTNHTFWLDPEDTDARTRFSATALIAVGTD